MYTVSYREIDRTTPEDHIAITQLRQEGVVFEEVLAACCTYHTNAALYDAAGEKYLGFVRADGTYMVFEPWPRTPGEIPLIAHTPIPPRNSYRAWPRAPGGIPLIAESSEDAHGITAMMLTELIHIAQTTAQRYVEAHKQPLAPAMSTWEGDSQTVEELLSLPGYNSLTLEEAQATWQLYYTLLVTTTKALCAAPR